MTGACSARAQIARDAFRSACQKDRPETISVMLAVFARVEPALRNSITFDNETAFAQHAIAANHARP
jgi:hypothetical protein